MATIPLHHINTITAAMHAAKDAAPPALSNDKNDALIAEIKALLITKNAQLIAHYYVDGALQQLADDTGGLVADSLDMAKFGAESACDTLIICGVRFMGETAKILSPDKRILMPSLAAECSLDLACPSTEFEAFCAAHPEREVVVYANTSAEVKALADWVVTSSNAVAIVKHLADAGKKLIFAPDRHLANWVANETGADMLHWQGHCVVHDEFRVHEYRALKAANPEAVLIAHPESPEALLAEADVIGSTKVLLQTINTNPATQFIVATDAGIFHKMREMQPAKNFMLAPTGGRGATCVSCGVCPWMALNSLERLRDALINLNNEIHVDSDVLARARIPIQRMVNFSAS